MSFFKNAKNLISASAGVVGKSVELMAELAEQLEREATIMSLRASIGNLERQVQNPVLDPGTPNSVRKKELLEKYKDLLVLLGNDGDKEIEAKRQALLDSEREDSVLALKAEISRFEIRVKETNYRLPVHELRDKQRLAGLYQQLFRLNDRALGEEGLEKNRWLAKDIQLLEERRRRIERKIYPSGQIKSAIRLLDEERDGECQWWYENGTLKAKIEFKEGLARGRCLVWYEGGEPAVEAIYFDERLRSPSSGFSRTGEEIIRIQNGSLEIKLWNGVSLGKHKTGSEGPFFKFGLILRMLMNFKIIRTLYRGREGGPDRALFEEWRVVIQNLTTKSRDVDVWIEG